MGYDSAGLLFRTTSLDAPSGGTVVNEVQRLYNGFGQLTQEYQDHFGPVNSSLTPKVIYSYSETSGGNHSRLTTMTYPNGRMVQYEYDPGIDTAISRLSRLTGDAVGGGLTSYEEYDYLGASTMVERGRPESGIKLTMVSQNGSVGDAGDPYTGLDRFGRVIDQRWIEGSGGSATDIDRYTYQFDRNSSRTARINQLDAAFSETYAFDGVDRLVDYARGGGGSGPQDQQWNLDALGNWTTITSDGTPESRTHNSQNELTGVGASSLAYDGNGNMIQDEAGRQLQYNAWNRLVRVSLSGDQVAAYQYDGYQHRIVTIVGDGPSAIARDLLYSAGWQVLEQRIRTGGSLGNVAEEQFVWSVAYIDGLILRDRNADLNAATGVNGLEERVYALHDALWNTTALLDVNGNVLDRFAYSPYGVVETLNPNWTPTASPSIPWAVLFRGYFADEGTGLLHARARQYSPTLGRFVSRDPIGYVDGLSLYSGHFVPNGLDPSGLCQTPIWEADPQPEPPIPQPDPVPPNPNPDPDDDDDGWWSWAGWVGEQALELAPVTGQAMSAYDAYENVRAGNYWAAAFDAASMFPPVKWASKAKKGATAVAGAVAAGRKTGPIPRSLQHDGRKEAREAAEFSNGGKKPQPPKDASSKKKKAYEKQQKYTKPERHQDSEYPENHFHDADKGSGPWNNHHTW
jgi:RHS repeat-associated protein